MDNTGSYFKSSFWATFSRWGGDCKALDAFLNSKHGLRWAPLKYLNALLRGVSQVNFANNPLTGLIILLSLFWADPIVGGCTLMAASTAILTSFVMGQNKGNIYAGLTIYNAVLIGSVTSSLWNPIYGEPLALKMWIFIAIGSAMSVFITTALANFFGSFKAPLPCLTLPFNIIGLLLFTILMPPPQSSPNPETNATMGHPEPLSWSHTLSGVIISSGQVYGVEDVIGSIFIYIGLFIFSPILCFMAFFGAVIGSISGFFFASSHSAVYSGLWGFNSILSASAVGGFFIVLTPHSFLLALANILFTVTLQQALAIAFGPLRLPVFTMPFCLSTYIFLQFTAAGDQLPRVIQFSFPEMHRQEHLMTLEEQKIKESHENGLSKTRL